MICVVTTKCFDKSYGGHVHQGLRLALDKMGTRAWFVCSLQNAVIRSMVDISWRETGLTYYGHKSMICVVTTECWWRLALDNIDTRPVRTGNYLQILVHFHISGLRTLFNEFTTLHTFMICVVISEYCDKTYGGHIYNVSWREADHGVSNIIMSHMTIVFMPPCA